LKRRGECEEAFRFDFWVEEGYGVDACYVFDVDVVFWYDIISLWENLI
jgi:hypothetical protein